MQEELLRYYDFCRDGDQVGTLMAVNILVCTMPTSLTVNVQDRDTLCLEHLFGSQLSESPGLGENLIAFDQTMFLTQMDFDSGFDTYGFAYIPKACLASRGRSASHSGACAMQVSFKPGCKKMYINSLLMIMRHRLKVYFHGCGGATAPSLDSSIVRIAEANRKIVRPLAKVSVRQRNLHDIVLALTFCIQLLFPSIKKNNNVTMSHPNSAEVARGCWDAYVQIP